MKKIFLVICMSVFLCGCADDDDSTKPQMDNAPAPMRPSSIPDDVVTKMGSFKGYEHGLAGAAYQYIDASGNSVLHFDSFTMTQGPDVHVFLSKANNFSSANTIEIAGLAKAYTNDSLVFTIDKGINLTSYKFVLVYCVQYNSLFGYAELN